jgi:serine/threonine protein kinase
MDVEQWRRVRPILESALELSPERRSNFLDSICSDAAVRREVDSLLVAHDQASPHALQFALSLPADGQLRFRLEPGRKVGAYEILEEIAQGGMGAVYKATRADGQYTQQVALKILRAELGGDWMSARFRNERQILAGLNHPNIAKIVDAGNTAEGLPYFVMELVEGQPITAFCESKKLSLDACLTIFQTVCSAVNYAHQHLVIHRDIKPSNILVTADGVPKLLDFGIAKVLDPALDLAGGAQTIAGFPLMTPEYASPEQLNGDAITTSADVYSLGLVLFELLTGQQAFDFPNHRIHEIARAVLENEPRKPSAVAPARLRATYAGDLDNIVAKALRKEPRERYSSPEQFAQDLDRYRKRQPVIAGRDTARYRAAKFIQRHRTGVITAASFALALIAALAAALWEARVARIQSARAEARFGEVRTLANSLMFDIHDAIQNLPGSTPARKLLVERALVHLDNLAREAGSDASLQRDLASAYERLGTVQGNPFGGNLGDTQGALSSYRKALAIRRAIQPATLDDTIAIAHVERLIGAIHANRSDGAVAFDELKAALAIAERVAATSSSNRAVLEELRGGYYMVGLLFSSFGDYESSARYFQKELMVVESLLKVTPHDRSLQHDLGAAEARTGDALAKMGVRAQGINHARRSIAILEDLAASGTDSESTRWLGMAHWMLGDSLLSSGDTAGALANYQEQLRLAKTLAAADPSNAVVEYDVGCSSARVGNALFIEGRRKAGMRMLDQAVGMLEVQARRDAAYIEPQFCLASALVWRSEAMESFGLFAPALDGESRAFAIWKTLAQTAPNTAIEADAALIRGRIASTQARLRRTELSSEEYREALKLAESIASSNPRLLEAQYVLADLYSGRGDLSSKLAATATFAPSERIRHLRDARVDYRRSLDLWQRISDPGRRTPTGFSCGNPQALEQRLASCEAALASLDKVTESQQR